MSTNNSKLKAHFGFFLPLFGTQKNLNAVKLTRMKYSEPIWLKKQIFPCFCVRQNLTSLSPICLNLAEFEVVPNKEAWITAAIFKVWFISIFALSIE